MLIRSNLFKSIVKIVKSCWGKEVKGNINFLTILVSVLDFLYTNWNEGFFIFSHVKLKPAAKLLFYLSTWEIYAV